MGKPRQWIAMSVLLVLALWLALAAPSALAQDSGPTPTPTDTPTPTATAIPYTPTPTATLPALPEGGGRVAVPVLVVRSGPSEERNAVGGLEYGTEIYPIARNTSGAWVAIQWEGLLEDSPGWVLESLVAWHPGFDVMILPVFTGFEDGIVGDTGATETPAPTLTPLPTDPPVPTDAPTATLQVTGTAVATVEPTATEQAAAVPAAEASVTPDPTQAVTKPPVGADAQPLNSQALAIVGGGIALLLLTIYGFAFVTGRKEVNRYADGFELESCPVCQSGTLTLDQTVSRPMGIPRVLQRSMRCDTCRSVMRSVRPGVWRYAIDPVASPELAETQKNPLVKDANLIDFARMAAQYDTYPDQADLVMAAEYQSPDEIVAEMEARYLEARAREAEEEAAAPAPDAAAAQQAAQDESASEDAEEEPDA